MARVSVNVTEQVVRQVTENLVGRMRRQMLALADAMRAEGISDETAARVLNRMALDVPDPDEVITPAGEGMLQRARRAAEKPIRRPV